MSNTAGAGKPSRYNLFIIIILLLTLAACDQEQPSPTPTAPLPPMVAPLPSLAAASPTPAPPTPSPPPTIAEVPQGGLLTVRLRADLNNFNPFVNSNDEGAVLVNSVIFSGLTRLDGRLQPQPDLAERWDVSADGKQLTFRLRDGVRWHDGQPLTAGDVLYTYETWATLPATTRLQNRLRAAGATVSTPDPAGNTVVFSLNQPDAAILSDLSAPILPAHKLRGVTADRLASDPFSFVPVGSGPFKFEYHTVGQNVVLTANLDYHFGKPNIERLAFLIAPDEDVAARALGDGSLLYGQLAYEQQRGLLDSLQRGSYAEDGYYYLGFNLRANRLFSDYRLRRALAYSLDRNALVREATAGRGLPVWSTALPNTWLYEPGTPRYEQDLDEARRLLADAGWQPGEGGTLQREGRPLAFRLYVRADDPTRRRAAEQIATQVAAVGISVTVAPVDAGSVLPALLDPTRNPAFDFDAILAGWGSLGYDYDPYPLFASDQQPTAERRTALNYFGYNNPDFSTRAAAAASSYNPAARRSLAADLQNTLAAELPLLPLWAAQYFTAASSRLAVSDGTAISLNTPLPFWNVERWYLQP